MIQRNHPNRSRQARQLLRMQEWAKLGSLAWAQSFRGVWTVCHLDTEAPTVGEARAGWIAYSTHGADHQGARAAAAALHNAILISGRTPPHAETRAALPASAASVPIAYMLGELDPRDAMDRIETAIGRTDDLGDAWVGCLRRIRSAIRAAYGLPAA